MNGEYFRVDRENLLAYGYYDRWLLMGALLLLGFGALMIYSSTSVITPIMSRKHITEFYYFKKHLFTMGLGFVAMLALAGGIAFGMGGKDYAAYLVSKLRDHTER